jgi:hypothetical protein
VAIFILGKFKKGKNEKVGLMKCPGILKFYKFWNNLKQESVNGDFFSIEI